MFISLLGVGSAQRSPQTTTDKNIRRLYLEILFASVLGAIITFNSAFAIRLKASNELVALLTSAPALIAAIGSIPSARFLSQRINRKAWLFGSLLVLRAGYLGVAFIPILFPVHTAEWLVAWIIVLNLPAIFFTNGFQVLLGDIIPVDRRALVVARRQIIWSVGTVAVSALSGAWLDRVPFPLNYELMYGFGFVTVLGSQYFLNRLEFLAKQTPLRVVQTTAPTERVTMRPPIRRLLINMIVYQLGLSVPASLFNIYYINTLHTNDGWIGLNSAAASAGVIVGYLLWERLLRHRTFGWSQRRATMLTWLFPVGLAFATDLNFIMFINFLVNVMHSGVDLSNFNVLLMISKPHERAAYVSWFNAAVNLSTFIAPLIGVWLAGQFGIPFALIVSGVIRIIGGILFNVNRVDAELPSAT
jgi:MFS family permease